MSRLELPDVTLCAVTSIAVPETLRAMERCLEQVNFGSAMMLTDHPPPVVAPSAIDWRRIEPIGSREEYSEFVLRRLVRHADRPHVLIVQWDGFVIDASRWRSEFLEFDYVGAPWPQFDDGRTVGNGGFSLRSRRLLELTASSSFPGSHPEDLSICRTYRTELEQEGIRFAPPNLAEQFAFERGPPRTSFGFHGLFNFPLVLSPQDLRSTLEDIDPSLLDDRDGADLIIKLGQLGELGQAWRLARRRPAKLWNASDLRFWSRLVAATGSAKRSQRRKTGPY